MNVNLNLKPPKRDYNDPKNKIWIDVKNGPVEKQVKEAESPIKEESKAAAEE